MATNPITPPAKTENEQYLQLISIFHYVVGGLAALIACFPIFHFAIGVGLVVSSMSNPDEAGPGVLFGLFFAVFAGLFILTGWAYAACIIIAGRYIAQRKRHMFCLVMAGVACMFTPFGTVLGVFTLVVLLRPEVKEMFGVVTAPAAPPAV